MNDVEWMNLKGVIFEVNAIFSIEPNIFHVPKIIILYYKTSAVDKLI